MKKLKFRRSWETLSNHAQPWLLFDPPPQFLPLYGPLELSRAVRSSLCSSSTLPSALPHRNKDNAWSKFFPPVLRRFLRLIFCSRSSRPLPVPQSRLPPTVCLSFARDCLLNQDNTPLPLLHLIRPRLSSRSRLYSFSFPCTLDSAEQSRLRLATRHSPQNFLASNLHPRLHAVIYSPNLYSHCFNGHDRSLVPFFGLCRFA